MKLQYGGRIRNLEKRSAYSFIYLLSLWLARWPRNEKLSAKGHRFETSSSASYAKLLVFSPAGERKASHSIKHQLSSIHQTEAARNEISSTRVGDYLVTPCVINFFKYVLGKWLGCRVCIRRVSVRYSIVETLSCTYHVYARKIRSMKTLLAATMAAERGIWNRGIHITPLPHFQ